MECLVCLGIIKEEDIIKKLSCDHIFHFQCYLDMVYRDKNIYIHCPLCRTMNTCVKKPTNDCRENIYLLCKKMRCLGKNLDGRSCKRRSKLLNYGYCYQHNKDVLESKYYPLMEKYMYLILCQCGNFTTKLRLIDIGKKIIIKFCNDTSSIDEVLEKYYCYFSLNDIQRIKNWDDIYDYYGLEKPPNEWIEYCSKNHCII